MSCGTMLPAMAFILWPSVLRGRWWLAGDGGRRAMVAAGDGVHTVAGRSSSFADIEAMIKNGIICKKTLQNMERVSL